MNYSGFRFLAYHYEIKFRKPLHLTDLFTLRFYIECAKFDLKANIVYTIRLLKAYFKLASYIFLCITHPCVLYSKLMYIIFCKLEDRYFPDYFKIWPEGSYQQYLNNYKLKAVEGLECSICLEEFEKDSQVRALKCSHLHVFHKKCLTKKIKRCPYCRSRI